MKLLVVSDIHGKYGRLERLMDMHKNADALIFLGDGLADLERAGAYSRGFTVFAVRGNCDVFSPFAEGINEEMTLNFEGYRLFLLHGHTRGVKHGMDDAVCAAVERDADIMLFGHTHLPIEKYIPAGGDYSLEKPLRLFNPGSLGESFGGGGSFGLIEIRKEGVLMSHGRI